MGSAVSPNDSVAGSLDPAYMKFGDTGGVMVVSDDNKKEQCTAILDVYASLGAAPVPAPASTPSASAEEDSSAAVSDESSSEEPSVVEPNVEPNDVYYESGGGVVSPQNVVVVVPVFLCVLLLLFASIW